MHLYDSAFFFTASSLYHDDIFMAAGLVDGVYGYGLGHSTAQHRARAWTEFQGVMGASKKGIQSSGIGGYGLAWVWLVWVGRLLSVLRLLQLFKAIRACSDGAVDKDGKLVENESTTVFFLYLLEIPYTAAVKI